MKLNTQSAEETQAIGRYLGERLVRGDVVGLDAPLGGGKTVMAKGLVEGLLGLDPDEVTSPAFTLVNEYRSDAGLPTVYHVDFYRLDELGEDEFEFMNEYLGDKEGITIVEWASKFVSALVREYIQIDISYSSPERLEERTILIRAVGGSERYNHLMSEISKYADAGS